jgi:hypothetical protein
MQIRPQEIDYKKEIGTLDGHRVMEIGLKGGYHIVCSVNGTKIDYLGVGPHRAVARYMAKKRKPDLQITELAKSEQVEPEHFQHQLPKFERILAQLIEASKK